VLDSSELLAESQSVSSPSSMMVPASTMSPRSLRTKQAAVLRPQAASENSRLPGALLAAAVNQKCSVLTSARLPLGEVQAAVVPSRQLLKTHSRKTREPRADNAQFALGSLLESDQLLNQNLVQPDVDFKFTVHEDVVHADVPEAEHYQKKEEVELSGNREGFAWVLEQKYTFVHVHCREVPSPSTPKDMRKSPQTEPPRAKPDWAAEGALPIDMFELPFWGEADPLSPATPCWEAEPLSPAFNAFAATPSDIGAIHETETHLPVVRYAATPSTIASVSDDRSHIARLSQILVTPATCRDLPAQEMQSWTGSASAPTIEPQSVPLTVLHLYDHLDSSEPGRPQGASSSSVLRVSEHLSPKLTSASSQRVPVRLAELLFDGGQLEPRRLF